MRRLTCQRGQAAIDYVGVLAAGAAIVALLVIAAPSLGEQLVCAVQNQLAKLGITEPCSAGDATAQEMPCVVSDSSGQIKIELTAFSLQGGGQVKVLRQEFAGGEVRIMLSGGGKLGIEVGEGGEAELDLGKGGGGGGLGITGALNLNGEGGGTWVFPSGDAADEFVDIVRNRARDTFLDRTLPPIGFLNHVIGTDEDRPLRAPDIVYLQGGYGGDVKGEGGPGGFAFEGTTVLGVRYDRRNDEKTAYLQIKNSGEASVAKLLGIDAKVELEGQIALTFDRHNNPIRATIIGKAMGDGIAGLAGTIKNPSDLISKLKINARGGGGNRIEIQGDLDLRNPDSLRALQDFASNPFSGAGALAGALLDDGRFNARIYETDRAQYGPSAKGRAGLAFGFDGTYESIDSDLIGAWKWDEGEGFRPWVTCKR